MGDSYVMPWVTKDDAVPGDPDLPRCEHSVHMSGDDTTAAYCMLPVDHGSYGLDHKAKIPFDALDPHENSVGSFNLIVTWRVHAHPPRSQPEPEPSHAFTWNAKWYQPYAAPPDAECTQCGVKRRDHA